MPREKMGPEQFKAAKEELNKVGMQMEEGEEGGAAVYVGTKEEVTKARQLAETEGRAPDLASYIVMHKQVLANLAELAGLIGIYNLSFQAFKDLPIGAMHVSNAGYTGLDVHFRDSSGNLAKVTIFPHKISSLKKENVNDTNPDSTFADTDRLTIKEQLKKLGFHQNESFSKLDPIKMEQLIQRDHLQKAEKEQKQGFAF